VRIIHEFLNAVCGMDWPGGLTQHFCAFHLSHPKQAEQNATGWLFRSK
jgi:hypothetical protein